MVKQMKENLQEGKGRSTFNMVVMFLVAFLLGSILSMCMATITEGNIAAANKKAFDNQLAVVSKLKTENEKLKTSMAQATQAQADDSLAYLSKVMPNTKFESASVSKGTPGLIRVMTSNTGVPAYFDPIRHYLIMGLVVDFSEKAMQQPTQSIAGGVQK